MAGSSTSFGLICPKEETFISSSPCKPTAVTLAPSEPTWAPQTTQFHFLCLQWFFFSGSHSEISSGSQKKQSPIYLIFLCLIGSRNVCENQSSFRSTASCPRGPCPQGLMGGPAKAFPGGSSLLARPRGRSSLDLRNLLTNSKFQGWPRGIQ